MTRISGLRMERRSLATLKAAPYNPRRISDEALSGLRASIEEFGLVQPVIVNERTGHVVGGHQRLKVLERLGETEVDVVLVDLPESKEKALNIALNNPHISGEFTDDLPDLLDDLAADEPELFEALRLDELEPERAEVEVEDLELDDVADEFWISCRGPLAGQSDVLEELKRALGSLEGVSVEAGILKR